MENNSFQEIWETLRSSKKILLSLHPRPDGDSLGCCAAMKYVLEKQGIAVTLVSQDPVTENLAENFSFSQEVQFGTSINDMNLDDFDFLLTLDSSSLSYLAVTIDIPQEKIINIDHHDTNEYYGRLNYVDPETVSCCSILVEFFKVIGLPFDHELSKRLLLGICTDSGFFQYKDPAESLEKAAYLIRQGNLDYQKEFVIPILKNEPWSLKKLHGILLVNMKQQEIHGKNVIYSFATREETTSFGLNSSELRLGVLALQDIKGADFVFTLTEMEEKIKGSFRSRGIDTTVYSSALGGGGHKEASAFFLEPQPMHEAIEKVLSVIKEKGITPA